ncbi:transcription repressor ofp17 [Phtheirospermum japonicum]|uniref:Transcription repressor ofp17 n=1 Tax=Phtheirospermum japonicum TaxID=374723 RepID=A0A830B788_9LAMI|nr:transcription repressor ofp17 [Phtheirospermum japonicum]
MDRVTELKSFSEAEHHKAPYPSPITPAYIRLSRKEVNSDRDDVDDSCRSFENYLVDMIVEEGKMRDLADVEEVLYCWENLRCPVFVDLVSRFYGELCSDLFSSGSEIDKGTNNGFIR